MKTTQDLREILRRIDGRGYKAYKDIEGTYQFGEFVLFIDHAQGDPFASPSNLRVRVPQSLARFAGELYGNRSRRVALEDYLTRMFSRAARRMAKGNRGLGTSGLIAMDLPGQEVIERSSVVVDRTDLEARFVAGLPARGRTVLGREAEEMLLGEVPRIVTESLIFERQDEKALRGHVLLAEDQDFIRGTLAENGLVAFVGNGAILPRASGIEDKPMPREKAVVFQSPPGMETEFRTPNNGPISGMGIRQGVTLILGGGYHGKSTLLRALERGVYNHILGDGREWVITCKDAVKIRAEDGRSVIKVDISPFINNLPYGQDTRAFTTEEASGSTSQAANIMEALEVGTSLLLLDEDTSATNFMIRDVRMQMLVAKEKEPITPFIDKVRQLYRDLGVSTVMVVGGSGDYFDVADHVIMMDEYRPADVTEEAGRVAGSLKTGRQAEGGEEFGRVRRRAILPEGLDPSRKDRVKIDAKGLTTIAYGNQTIQLYGVEQLVDIGQTRAIGDIVYYAVRKHLDGGRTVKEILESVEQDMEAGGLDSISPFQGRPRGDYVRPRPYEVAAAINRCRSLRVR